MIRSFVFLQQHIISYLHEMKSYKNCRKLEKKWQNYNLQKLLKITIEIIFTLIRLIHEKSVTLLFIYFF